MGHQTTVPEKPDQRKQLVASARWSSGVCIMFSPEYPLHLLGRSPLILSFPSLLGPGGGGVKNKNESNLKIDIDMNF